MFRGVDELRAEGMTSAQGPRSVRKSDELRALGIYRNQYMPSFVVVFVL
jgi:hypothetical protein